MAHALISSSLTQKQTDLSLNFHSDGIVSAFASLREFANEWKIGEPRASLIRSTETTQLTYSDS